MECGVRQIDPCRCRISIKIPVEESETAYADRVEAAQRQARADGIPGFRRNKIPDAVIMARLGPQIEQQAFQKVVNNAVDNALAANNVVHHTQMQFQFQSSRLVWRGKPIVFDVTFYNRVLHPALIKLPGARGDLPAWSRIDGHEGEIGDRLWAKLQADKGGSHDVRVSAG